MPRILGSTSTHSALPDVTIDQHHVRDHAVSGATHTGTLLAAQFGNERTEAKVTAGAASSEAVSWTTAFGGTPMVTTGMDVASPPGTGEVCYVVSRSTTGATVQSANTSGINTTRVKNVVARVAS